MKDNVFWQDILLQKGYHAVAAELASEQELACNEVLSCKKIILLPVPVSEVMLKKMIPFFSKKHIILGGNLPKNFVTYCNEHEIACLDYMKIPEIAIETQLQQPKELSFMRYRSANTHYTIVTVLSLDLENVVRFLPIDYMD